MKTCPWWVMASIYHNCCFVAAEVGEHTLAEIGSMLGLTKERIRQIEMGAIKKLRKFHELLYKQGLVERGRQDTSEDKRFVREDKGNIVYRLLFGDLGVPEWGGKKSQK